MNKQNQELLYHNNNKKQYKKIIRKDCNKIGVMLLISFIVMQIVSTVLIIMIQFSGNYDYTMKTGVSGIPYNLYYILNIIYEFSGFFIVPLFFCIIFKFRLRDAIPLQNNKRYSTALMVFAGYSVCTISNFFVLLLNNNLKIFGLENKTGTEFVTKTTNDEILFFIAIAIIPALVEEFIFRGVILNFLRKHGDGFAILVSSILFGIFHGNFVQIPFAFIVGLTCGVLMVKTNSIIVPMLLHFLNNGTSVLIDISKNHLYENTFIILYSIIMLILAVAGFINIILLCKKGFTLRFEEKTSPTYFLSSKEKITSMLSNPGIIIVCSVFILSGIYTLLVL